VLSNTIDVKVSSSRVSIVCTVEALLFASVLVSFKLSASTDVYVVGSVCFNVVFSVGW